MTSKTLPAPPSSTNGRLADATSVLTFFLVLQLWVPSQLTIGAIGGSGSPAQLLSLACLVWWLAERVRQPAQFLTPTGPTTRFLLLFVGAVLASFVVAATRPISDDELRSSQQGLLGVAGWLGVYLVTADGISTPDRLEALLGRFARITGAIAVLAIIQFVTRQSWVDKVEIPGLTSIHPLGLVSTRGGLNRPAGTSVHPIEFGVLLTMALPLALHLALFGRSRSRFARFYPAVTISMVIPISISRSTLLGAALVLLVLLPTWPRVWRRVCYMLLAVGGGFLYVLSPGVVNTLTGLFVGISKDSSTLSRTDSYDLALQFVAVWPVFGRGFLTFLPEYRILDNQYLGLLIDTGFVGLGSFLAVVLSAMVVCLRVRRRLVDARSRHLTQACLASVCAGALGFAFFDAMSFPMTVASLFFVLGCTAALHRLTRDTPHGAVGVQTSVVLATEAHT